MRFGLAAKLKFAQLINSRRHLLGSDYEAADLLPRDLFAHAGGLHGHPVFAGLERPILLVRAAKEEHREKQCRLRDRGGHRAGDSRDREAVFDRRIVEQKSDRAGGVTDLETLIASVLVLARATAGMTDSVGRRSLDMIDDDELARALAAFERQTKFSECVKDRWPEGILEGQRIQG